MSEDIYIGVAHLELHIPEARSLKAKRGPVRSLIEKIRNRHQVLVIGLCDVVTRVWRENGSDELGVLPTQVDVEARLRRVEKTIDLNWTGHVLSWEIEIIQS